MEIFRLFAAIAVNKDEVISDLSDVNSAGERTGSSLGQSFQNVGGSLTNVGGKMTAFVTGPLAGLAAGAIAATAALGNQADKLLDLEQQTGLSTNTLQEFTNVARVAGVDVSALTGPAEALFRNMHQLDDGSTRAGGALADLGVSARGADGELRSTNDLLPEIIHALQGMEDITERNTLATSLFRGSASALAPVLGMTADQFEEARAQAHELGHVLERDTLNQANDLRVGMAQLTGELGNAGREVVVSLLPIVMMLINFIRETAVPTIRSLSERVSGLIDWFSNLPEPVQKVIGVVLALLAAAGPVITVIGGIISTIGTLMPLLPALGAAFTILTGPIGLVIAAITAAIAIGVAIVRNWDSIKEAAGRVWGWIRDAVTNAVQAVRDRITGMIDAVQDLANQMLERIRALPGEMLQLGRDIIQGLINGVQGMIGQVREAISNVGENLIGRFRSLLGISSPSRVFTTFGRNIGEGLAAGIRSTAGDVAGAAGDLADAAIGPMERAQNAANLQQIRQIQDQIRDIQRGVREQPGRGASAGVQRLREFLANRLVEDLERQLNDLMNRQRQNAFDAASRTPTPSTPGRAGTMPLPTPGQQGVGRQLEVGAARFDQASQRFTGELQVTAQQLARAVNTFSRDVNQNTFADMRA